MKKSILFVTLSALSLSFNACTSKTNDTETKQIEATQAKNADSSKNSMVNDLNSQLGIDTTKKQEEKKTK